MMARGWSASACGSMLVLLAIYFVLSNRVASVSQASPLAVLAPSGAAPVSPDFRVAVADARVAVMADPINQRLVNVAMLAAVQQRPGVPDRAWFAALVGLGWRDTPSRQNLLIHHALQNDVSAVLDDADGLLRRNQLIDEITPVLLTVEADPTWQGGIVGRLRRHPSWRFSYLQRGSLIDDPGQLAARARTIRMLQRSGDDVAAGEIAPVLPKLLAANLGASAFAIWHAREPSIARPVADPRFEKLAAEREPSSVPFHWQVTSGPDYSVDAATQPAAHLTVGWNGAGAPVFAMQYLSAPAGRYAVVLTSPAPDDQLPVTIGVRAVCGSDMVEFGRWRHLSPTRTAFTGDRAVPCAFPRLELFGRPGAPGSHERQAAISGIAITRSI